MRSIAGWANEESGNDLAGRHRELPANDSREKFAGRNFSGRKLVQKGIVKDLNSNFKELWKLQNNTAGGFRTKKLFKNSRDAKCNLYHSNAAQ